MNITSRGPACTGGLAGHPQVPPARCRVSEVAGRVGRMTSPCRSAPGRPRKRRRRRWSTLLLGLALLAACSSRGEPGAPPVPSDAPPVAVPSDAFSALVTRVVDGDTVVAQVDGQGPRLRVRLLGIDTPETVKPGAPVACFGHQASAFSTSLLTGQRVRAIHQAEEVDGFGRQLWDLWLPDGRFVATLLTASGAARAYPYPPNTAHAADIAAGEDLARAQRRGLWGSCALTAAFPQLRQ